MKWNLDEVASFAEIVAAIGVIVSLIFVGIQLQEGNQETRASTIQAATDSELRITELFIRYAATWDKVVRDVEITDEEEHRRSVLLMNALMIESENRYHQHLSGFLESDTWETRHSTLQQLVKLSVFRGWRKTLGAQTRSPAFLKLIDGMQVVTDSRGAT